MGEQRVVLIVEARNKLLCLSNQYYQELREILLAIRYVNIYKFKHISLKAERNETDFLEITTYQSKSASSVEI